MLSHWVSSRSSCQAVPARKCLRCGHCRFRWLFACEAVELVKSFEPFLDTATHFTLPTLEQGPWRIRRWYG